MHVQQQKIIALFFTFNFLLILLFNFSVFTEINSEWWSTGPYSHGLLGFVLSLYCFWLKRDCFHNTHYGLGALLFIVISALLMLLATLASLGQLQQLSLFLITCALLTTVYGFKILKDLFLPLFILLLTLPVWNILQIPLRELSTSVSFFIVDQLNFAIIRDGFNLITPQGTFIVEQACSGLGFFLVSALYAIFITLFNQLTYRAGFLFVTIAVAMAVIANWIRIIIIIIVGSQTNMQHFVVQDHLTFGWFVFVACYLPIIWIGLHYFDAKSFDQQSVQTKKKKNSTSHSFQHYKRYLFSVSALLLLLSSAYLFFSSRFDADYQFSLPQLTNYQLLRANKTSSPNWHPTSHGASSELFSYFLQDKLLIQVYLANYTWQKQGKEMIFVENSLFDQQRWRAKKNSELTITSNDLIDKINLLVINKNRQNSRLIAYWYFVNGHFTGQQQKAKWESLTASLKGKPGATLIAVALDYKTENKEKALQELSQFVSVFLDHSI